MAEMAVWPFGGRSLSREAALQAETADVAATWSWNRASDTILSFIFASIPNTRLSGDVTAKAQIVPGQKGTMLCLRCRSGPSFTTPILASAFTVFPLLMYAQ